MGDQYKKVVVAPELKALHGAEDGANHDHALSLHPERPSATTPLGLREHVQYTPHVLTDSRIVLFVHFRESDPKIVWRDGSYLSRLGLLVCHSGQHCSCRVRSLADQRNLSNGYWH
jgi:hypothetical protein